MTRISLLALTAMLAFATACDMSTKERGITGREGSCELDQNRSLSVALVRLKSLAAAVDYLKSRGIEFEIYDSEDHMIDMNKVKEVSDISSAQVLVSAKFPSSSKKIVKLYETLTAVYDRNGLVGLPTCRKMGIGP